ncbi:cell wall hydrolase [Paracoccus sp. (in: a-proteobacteria)]|uniref:cell wall hydrolase n=1 Tax=Paracoccus sp. TaxID=267 RepID=UPI0026DF55E9|nr:cell wall hydrolase [Paracoccus sp. (in: a-proteobacteria)]MDO5646705.1 cell wall hydrolase [Paracoccus sp. (in: a-proteobacteria)]
MQVFSFRLARFAFCAAISLIITAETAVAGGNGSLFGAGQGMMGAAGASPMVQSQATPLLFSAAPRIRVKATPEVMAEQVQLARTSRAYSQADLDCMTEALYHEARGEGRVGQAAVAEVILNRVDDRRFPSTVCGVINQPRQFSYTIGGTKPMRNQTAVRVARQVAENALSGAPRELTGGATYFHTPAVRPAWSNRFQRTVQIGRHIFYRPHQRVAAN